ncbi:hypothetical protein ACFQ0B_49705 [Nonomuraea thailandensis]
MTTAVAQVGEWLGLGGSILANLFNPRVIVIGGYFASLAQWLLPHAQDQLQRLVVAAPAARCRFVASTLASAPPPAAPPAWWSATSSTIRRRSWIHRPGRHLTDGPHRPGDGTLQHPAPSATTKWQQRGGARLA